MNIMLIVFAVLASAIVVFLIVAVFAEKGFTVQRELLIDSPSGDVFDHIKYLENHRTFSKWTTKDTNKRVAPRGIDGVPGFIQPWHNFKERAGVGELEIKKVREGSAIELEHRYFKPVRGTANTVITIESAPGNKANVKWSYEGFSRYPLNLLTAMMDMDRIVGNDLEECLAKLRHTLEGEKIDGGSVL